jgi:hypothetical protein
MKAAMSLRHSLPVLSILTTIFVAGCAAASSDDEPAAAEALQQASRGVICDRLGTNDPTLLESNGSKMTMTRRGGKPEVGTKTADPAPGFTGYRFGNRTLWLSTDQTKSELHEDNVGPHWEGTCHPATSAELSADACAIFLRNEGYGSRPAHVEKVTSTQYRITSSAAAGDFVWTAETHGTGFDCQVDFPSLQALSCPAVVADAIGSRARDDGSSAGSPYVKHESGTSWSGGIHDPESGEFAYTVKTSSTADHCKVVSIESTTDSQ